MPPAQCLLDGGNLLSRPAGAACSCCCWLRSRLLVVAKLHRWLDAAAGGSRSPSRGGSRWQVVTWREETHGRRQL